jgi:hypothetical protein
MKPERLSDSELLEAIELAANRIGLAIPEDLRHVGDVLAGLALEARNRIAARGRDVLRARASRLEDAAFHFQTCSTCRREGDGACNSGRWFAAYLRGEHDEEGGPPTTGPGPSLGKIRDVRISQDGTLTAIVEVHDGGRKLFAAIKGANHGG